MRPKLPSMISKLYWKLVVILIEWFEAKGKLEQNAYKLRVWFRITGANGEPRRCPYCGSNEHKAKVVDTINYDPCEIKYICKKCGKQIGYWAYGNYD